MKGPRPFFDMDSPAMEAFALKSLHAEYRAGRIPREEAVEWFDYIFDRLIDYIEFVEAKAPLLSKTERALRALDAYRGFPWLDMTTKAGLAKARKQVADHFDVNSESLARRDRERHSASEPEG